MSPDPPVDLVDGCLSCNYDVGVAFHSSDDSDSETGHAGAGYDGYTLLGQHENGGGPHDNGDTEEMESGDSNESNASNVNIQANVGEPSAPPSAGRAELIALWNMPATTSSGGITIDDERSAQIRAAMAGFTLPASSVPAWAAHIPEEQWKQRLLDRLQQSGQMDLSQSSGSTDNKPSIIA